MKKHPFPSPQETDPRLLEALASLNQISNAINHIGSDDAGQNDLSLALIVESAIHVVPGSSAVMKTQSRSATPDELMTNSGNHPSAHSASRTGHKSGKTLAGDACSLCL